MKGKYVVKTLQYGEFEDVYTHDDIDALKNDLLNIAHLGSIAVTDILEDGRPLSVVRKRILLSQARRDASRCLGTYLSKKGVVP